MTVSRVIQGLRAPVDGASLALFRILVGLFAAGWLGLEWPRLAGELLEPEFHFAYPGFEWLRPLPGQGLYWCLGALIAAAACIALGLASRAAAAVLCLGYAYLFLLDLARYSNTGYLLVLASFLLIWLPADRAWSLGAQWRRGGADCTVPRWATVAVMAFVAVPLLYMGFSRLNPDWLAGYPLRLWFRTAASGHVLGDGVSDLLRTHGFAKAWSWFAALVHLAVVPLLLWRRTRLLAVVIFATYYLGTSLIFERVIFPFLLAAGMVVFFEPGWPRRVLRGGAGASAASEAKPLEGGRIGRAVAAAFLVFHVLLPARALFYPGAAAWTGDGYRFAWRDMLDDKYCEYQWAVVDPASKQRWEFEPRSRLTAGQARELAVRPDMLPQFARFLARIWETERSVPGVQVNVRAKCSLNTRPFSQLVDSRLDLTQTATWLGPTRWVLPMDTRMPPGWRGIVQN